MPQDPALLTPLQDKIGEIEGGIWYSDEPAWPAFLSRFKPECPKMPAWACHPEIVELSRSVFKGGTVPLGCTCGPAVKYAFLATANFFVYWLLLPIFAYFLSSCPEDSADSGFAICNDPLLFGFFGCVTAPIQVYLQFKCLSYVVLPQLAVVKRFDLGPILLNKLPYYVFLGFFFGISIGGLLDTETNAEVLGRVLFTAAHCPAASAPLELRWQKTMNHSFITKLPGFKHSQYWHVCLFAYLLQLAAPLFALAYGIPRPGRVERNDSSNASNDAKKWEGGGSGKLYSKRWPDYCVGADSAEKRYKFQYRTLFCYGGTNHGAVVQVMASLARMEAVNFADLKFAERKMDALLESAKHGNPRDDWQEFYLALARVQLERGVAKFVIVGCIQNCIQTNLQVSIVGMSYAVTGALDPQMFFSILMCLLGTLGDFPDMIELFVFVRKIYINFRPYVDYLSEDAKKVLNSLFWRLVRFSIYITMYMSITIWSLAKLVALFACKHHLWNVDINFMAGCA